MKKKKFKSQLKITKESTFLFWVGIGFGILGGVVGNFVVTSSGDIAYRGYNWFNSSIYVITFLILLVILYFAYKQMKINIKWQTQKIN